jgi:hypothetical protein
MRAVGGPAGFPVAAGQSTPPLYLVQPEVIFKRICRPCARQIPQPGRLNQALSLILQQRMPNKPPSPPDQLPVPVELVERRIYLIRGQEVMLDSDLAELGKLAVALRA